MLLLEQELNIPVASGQRSLIEVFRDAVADRLPASEMPIRFVVTGTDASGHHCELAALSGIEELPGAAPESIFEFIPRKCERTDDFTAVLLVPTGIGAEIGGHAG
ncbi:unnamed protein product, partial [marine sediment metagenome]